MKDPTENPKFSFGLAKFHLKDLLNPHCSNMKMRSDVFPVKRALLNNENNLDLNTTARKEERAIEKSSPYLINGTYYVISVDLAYNIGEFDEAKEIEELKRKLTEEEGEQEAPKEDLKQQDAKETSEDQEKTAQDNDVETINDVSGAIYERAVYILPYENSAELLKKIYDSIEQINLEGLNLENVRHLNTKEFSDTEKQNRLLDFIGGFELMDSEFRMVVLEGLGGKGHSMNKFYNMNLRSQPNQRRLKLLYNPNVRFKFRLYWDFNASIKRIKLRDTLTKIMSSPDVFLRSKVPEEIYDTLQKLAEMRKFDRIKYLKDYNLFPESERLLALERKYGNSLNYKDLYGIPQKQKKKKVDVVEPTLLLTKDQEESMRQTQQESLKKVTIDERATNYSEERTKHRSQPKLQKSTKNNLGFTPKNKVARRERLELPEGAEVYLYSGQKLNYFEQQKEEIRKSVANDKAHFYTYSPDHLSLAFPVVNENEIEVKEKMLNQSKWRTPEGFHNVTKKPKEEYNVHPKKPPQ